MRLMLAATVPVVSAIATLPTLMLAASLQIKKFATGMNWSGARVDAIKTAGYGSIKVEPRLTTASQRRADIFYVDRSSHNHIHYCTDDVVCHPLCESHIEFEGEVLDTARLSVRLKD
jgi:hypothetical protein